jgi:dihydroorotase
MLSIEGIIVLEEGQMRKRVEIDTETGLIVRVAEPSGSADVVLGNSELVFPGFIDLHVHAREDAGHTQEYKEDFKSASAAAINGGLVAFADMPNNVVPPVDDASYEAKRVLADTAPIEIVLYAGIGPHTNPLARAVPYKAFMGHSIGDLFFSSREELDATLERYRGQRVSFHAEDPKIMDEHKGDTTHESRRPKEAEISAVDIALALIEKHSLVGKICHASTVEAIAKITAAKARGVSVSVEVTPHHLYFDEAMFGDRVPVRFQVNPPIRQTRENRLGLIEALKRGDIDYLATDHAPHSKEEKEQGMSGLTHLDTYGPFTTWLMQEHGFRPEDITRVCANAPGRFISEFTPEKYGKIQEGYVGSLTVLSPNTPILIRSEDLQTKCKWSPFEGIEFPGRVTMTIIKGAILKNEHHEK